jgi:hypothetical protein
LRRYQHIIFANAPQASEYGGIFHIHAAAFDVVGYFEAPNTMRRFKPGGNLGHYLYELAIAFRVSGAATAGYPPVQVLIFF